MAHSTSLTCEEALALQDALFFEYRKPEFQQKLRSVLQTIKEFERELCEIRKQVGLKFGFEASLAGVSEDVAVFQGELLVDPDIAMKIMQDYFAMKCNLEACSNMVNSNTADLKEMKQKVSQYKQAFLRRAPIIATPSRRWVVVGGGSKGGIVVRKGKHIQSLELVSRLATGALVEEMELINARLHYKKIRGDGPDFGWVSIFFKGTMLLEPYGMRSKEKQQESMQFVTVECASSQKVS